jgi:segregation and condensation protein B
MARRSKKTSPGDDLGLSAFRQVPEEKGLPLDRVSAALAGMLGSGDDPYAVPPAADSPAGDVAAEVGQSDPACLLSPRSILEAMLFVGSPTNEPLSSKQVAALMRGVRPAEIDALVRDLNAQYDRLSCPYTIASEGLGYRLRLRDQYVRVHDKFYGKQRRARLSRAAIEVLAAVAYHAPITADEISRMRGVASGPVLVQLVRRQLVRLERTTSKPRRVQYFTTDRFLELFGLRGLEDLPRSQDLEQG